MKIKYIIIGLVALAFISGCSKSRTEAQQAVNDEAWVNDESLPVPVTFSAPGVEIESKALITGTATTEDMHFGVYGLATTYDEPSSSHNPAWWDDQPDTKLMENVKAVGGSEFKFKQDDWSNDLTVYYPMGSEKTFSFYAYYPYGNTEYSGNCFSVTYDLKEVPDVMWAESHAVALDAQYGTEDRLGFNAAYIRRVKRSTGGEDKLPKLDFTHKLAALQFNAVTSDGSESSNYTITGLELVDISQTATLVIASNGDYSGATQAGEVRGGAWGPIPLLNSEGLSEFEVVPNATGNEIGTMVIVPVAAGTAMKANVSIKLGDQEPNTQEVTFSAPSGGFKAGYRYVMNVKVLSGEEVSIFATSVKEWNDNTPAIDIDEPIG